MAESQTLKALGKCDNAHALVELASKRQTLKVTWELNLVDILVKFVAVHALVELGAECQTLKPTR